jgi:hypothetical protein
MISSRVLRICAVGFALLLLLLATPAARAQSGNEITASYQVTDSVANGSQLRVTLRVRLINHAEQSLTVTQVSLRGFFPVAISAETQAPVLLRAHGSSNFTPTFTISPQEFQHWQSGARPRLLLKVLTDDGRELTRTIAPTAALASRPGVE